MKQDKVRVFQCLPGLGTIYLNCYGYPYLLNFNATLIGILNIFIEKLFIYELANGLNSQLENISDWKNDSKHTYWKCKN